MSRTVQSIRAIEVLDSRGFPTVRTFVVLDNGTCVSSSVPSGASTGTYEAVELRDDDPTRYHGKGVLHAVDNVNTILFKKLQGMFVENPIAIDKAMIEADGTQNKSSLGANAILSVSQAVHKAAAVAQSIPLWKLLHALYQNKKKPSFPRLMVNVINGGKHAQWNFDIQEFIIIPLSSVPSESVRVASEIYYALGKLLKTKSMSTLVGDEGGYSPLLETNEEAFAAIITSAKSIGYVNTEHFNLGLDAAASEFFSNGNYVFKKNNKKMTGNELIAYYINLKEIFHVASYEDPFAEDDWIHFGQFTKTEGAKSIIIGDDVYVTNVKRIKRGIREETTNAVLIKPNQIGSIYETALAIQMAQNAGWKVVVSHRSGETEDPFIADLAYGMGADFLKTGSMARSERLAKYNRLLEIENNL